MEFDMTNYFQGFNTTDSYIILLILFVAFLFGLLLGWLLRSRKVIRLKREVKDLKKKQEELKTTIDDLNEQLELRDADLQKAAFDLEEREAKTGRLEREKTILNNELIAVKEELEKLQASNKTYASTIEDLNDQILGLKTKNVKLSQEKKREENDIDELAQFQSSFNATRQRLESLEAKIGNLENENEKLKDQVEDLKDQQIQPIEIKLKDNKKEEKTTSRSISSEPILQDGGDLNKAATTETVPQVETIENPATLFVPNKSVLDEKILVDEQERDELTRIEGIGPFLEKKLNEINIFTYVQIAKFDQATIEEVTKKIGYFPGRIEKDQWVEQAAKLHQQKLENPFEFAVKQSAPILEEDLKIIEGIGPKIEQLIKDAGIMTLQQLAESEVAQLRDILDEAGDRYRIHDPGTWPAQARLAANEEWELLEEYQEELKGGRNVD
ncbi:MAG: lipopolysaccharide assembly protein LapA domain-containing protein [Saprospiraceae bacterium]|nr:lipopolysaccharide assembly protein LapA domain-containing protein [Saprospiraceae bacterium]